MEFFKQLATDFFDVTSVWSVVFRAIIWIVISVLILMATDNPDPEKIKGSIKSNLGFFLLFILVSTSLIMLLFGVGSA